MRWARIRNFVLIGLVLLAAASMLPSFGGGSKPKPASVHPERARFEAAGKSQHPRVAAARLPPIDSWAER